MFKQTKYTFVSKSGQNKSCKHDRNVHVHAYKNAIKYIGMICDKYFLSNIYARQLNYLYML